MMFNKREIEFEERPGWLSRENVVAGMLGLVTGVAIVLTLTVLGGGGGEGATITELQVTTRGVAPTTGAPAADPASTGAVLDGDRLRYRALSRPVRFGSGGSGLPAAEEEAFAAALGDEALAAVDPVDERLVLAARSRARTVRFGDREMLTEDDLESVRLEEWWTAPLEGEAK